MQLKLKGMIRYPHLFTASAAQGAERRSYSVQVLIHKSDAAQIQAATTAIQTAIAERFPQGQPAGLFHNCWKDLAIEEPGNPVVADYMAMTFRQDEEQGQPPVVDLNRQPVIDPGAIQPGDVVWVVGETFAFNQASKGVKTYLNVTMATGEKGAIPSEQLSSRPSVDELLNDLPGGAPAPAAPAAPAPAAPVAPVAAPAQVAPVPSAPAQVAPVAAPAAPAPAPAAPAPAAPAPIMTAAAQGATYEAMKAAGWTDEALVANGMMIQPSYTG